MIQAYGLEREEWGFRFEFQAMASQCEIRVECDDAVTAEAAVRAAENEARRIEQKFSRYREDSVVTQINHANGLEIELDDETSQLVDFADQCFSTTRGLFDITSGVLRRVWKFDGTNRVPSEADIRPLRHLIGWRRALWRRPVLQMKAGMEIDFGGIGKEYAVDRALASISHHTNAPALVNFGGDLRVNGPRTGGAAWKVGIESVDAKGTAAGILELHVGALATSGDMNRFLLKDGVRYSHILNPQTGWPVVDPPRAITVAAATCVEAGTLATMAMLQGRRAETFLRAEGVQAWCVR